MPKLGMGPVRRAEIFKAAIEVISTETFCGTTIKKVADRAGVSTGTVNHYFDNKLALLIETLKQVSAEWNEDVERLVDAAAPGKARLAALASAIGPVTPVNSLRWKVWIAAWGESVQSPDLRLALHQSWQRWLVLLGDQFERVAKELDRTDVDTVRLAREYDALQNGLYVQMLSAGEAVSAEVLGILDAFLLERLGVDLRRERALKTPAVAKRQRPRKAGRTS